MVKKRIIGYVCVLFWGWGFGQEAVPMKTSVGHSGGTEIDAIISCVNAHRYMRDMSDAGSSFRTADLRIRHQVFPFLVSNRIENIQLIAAVNLCMHENANYLIITGSDVFCFDRPISVSPSNWVEPDVKIERSAEINLALETLKSAILSGEQVKRSYMFDSSSAFIFVKTNQAFSCEYMMNMYQKGSRICTAFNALNEAVVKIKNRVRTEKNKKMEK